MNSESSEVFVERNVSYSLEIAGRLIVVEQVPARISLRTGERYFSPATVERTAIFVRWPASRASATISTEPSAISGTSSANRPRTRSGCVRDTVTVAARGPRPTDTTRHFRRLPCE